MNLLRRRLQAVVVALLLLAAPTGCSVAGSPAGGVADDEVGPITFVHGKTMSPTTSSFVKTIVDDWNRDHPEERVGLVEIAENPDPQRTELLENARTRHTPYDVVMIDNAWTTEFAALGVIAELPRNEFDLEGVLPPLVDAVSVDDRLYAFPARADGAMLYYRTDLLREAGIDHPPRTWQEMFDACRRIWDLRGRDDVECYAGQLSKYEGLTGNFVEAVASSGGVVSDEAGRPHLNSAEARVGLDFLVEGLRDGYISEESLSYDEEASRRAFQEGRLVFERQWPYQYDALSRTDGSSAVAGKFDVSVLPGRDGPGVSVVGGHSAALWADSGNKRTALAFIRYLTSRETNRKDLVLDSKAPVYEELYDAPELRELRPFLPVLKESIRTSVTRPRLVRYGEATVLIQQTVSEALHGRMSSGEALDRLQAGLVELAG
jgi:multiple sugar transport system substrate-binding protein